MNQFGKDLKLIYHVKHGTPIIWPVFLLWYLTQKNLPDINLTLLFEKKNKSYILPNYIRSKKINVIYCEFNDDLNLLVKNTKNKYFNRSIFIDSLVFPIDVLDKDIMESIESNSNKECLGGYVLADTDSKFSELNFVSNIKTKDSKGFVSINDGWGNFNMSIWLNRQDNPLVYDFRNSYMSHQESVFGHFWNDAGKISNLFY